MLLEVLGNVLRPEGGSSRFAATAFVASRWSGQTHRHRQLLDTLLFQDHQEPEMATVEIKYPLTNTKKEHLGCLQNLMCSLAVEQEVPTLISFLEQVQEHFTRRFGSQDHAKTAGQAMALYTVLPFFTHATSAMLMCEGESLIQKLDPHLGGRLPEAAFSLAVLSNDRPANVDVVEHLLQYGYMDEVLAMVALGARVGRMKPELDAMVHRSIAATGLSLDTVLEVFSALPTDRQGPWSHINLCSSDFAFSPRLPDKMLVEDTTKRVECLLSFFEGEDYSHRFHPVMEKLVALSPPHLVPRLRSCVQRHLITHGLGAEDPESLKATAPRKM